MAYSSFVNLKTLRAPFALLRQLHLMDRQARIDIEAARDPASIGGGFPRSHCAHGKFSARADRREWLVDFPNADIAFHVGVPIRFADMGRGHFENATLWKHKQPEIVATYCHDGSAGWKPRRGFDLLEQRLDITRVVVTRAANKAASG